MVNFGDFPYSSALLGGFHVVTVLTDLGLNIKISRKQVNWYISWQGLILKKWWNSYCIYRNCVIYQFVYGLSGEHWIQKDMSDMWSPPRFFAWSHPILKRPWLEAEAEQQRFSYQNSISFGTEMVVCWTCFLLSMVDFISDKKQVKTGAGTWLLRSTCNFAKSV